MFEWMDCSISTFLFTRDQRDSIMAPSEGIRVTGFSCTAFLGDLLSLHSQTGNMLLIPQTCQRLGKETNPTTCFPFMNLLMFYFRNAPDICTSQLAKNSNQRYHASSHRKVTESQVFRGDATFYFVRAE